MSNLINASDLGLFEKLDAQLAKTATEMEKVIGKFEKLRDLLDGDLKQKLIFIRNEVRDVAVDAAKSGKILGQLEDQVQKLKAGTEKYHAQLQQGSQAARKYEKEIKTMRQELNKLKQAKDQGTVSTQKFNSGIQSLVARFSLAYIGANLFMSGLRGIQTQFKEALDSSMQFEREMKATEAVTRATSAEVVALTANANKLGATTEYTSSQIAILQKELGKLGFTASEAINATEAISDLATATQEDLVKAGTVAASTLRIFNMDATQTTKVVDIMTGSFVRSALDLEKYRESMKLLGPIAFSAGIDLETTTAILSRLADAGLSGSLAGTSLRNILSRMADPTSKISKLLGGTVKNSEELISAFQRMKATGIGLTETIQLMDVRARPAFLTFLQQVDSIKGLRDEYRNLNGEGSRLADMMRDTLANDVEILNSAFDALRREGIDGMNAGLRTATQLLTTVTEAIRLMIAEKVDFQDFWKGLSSAITSFFTDIDQGRNELENLVAGAKLEESVEQLEATLDGVSNSFKDASPETRAFVKELSDAKTEVSELESKMAKGLLTQEEYSTLIEKQNNLQGLSSKLLKEYGEQFIQFREDGSLDPQIASFEAFINKQEQSALLGVKAAEAQRKELAAEITMRERLADTLDEEFRAKNDEFITRGGMERLRQAERLSGLNEQMAKDAKELRVLYEAQNKTQDKAIKNENALREAKAKLQVIDQRSFDLRTKESELQARINKQAVEGGAEAIEAQADYLAIREQELKFEVERLQKTVTSEKMAYETKLGYAQKLRDKREELAKAELQNEIAQIERSAKNESDRLTRKILAQNKYKNDVEKAEQELTIFINNEMQKRVEAEMKALDRRIELNSRMVRRQIQILSETNAAMQGNAAIDAENAVKNEERVLERLTQLQFKKTKESLDRLASLKRAAAQRQFDEQVANNNAQFEAEKKTIMRSQEFLAQSPQAQQEVLDQLKQKYDTYLTGLEKSFAETNAQITFETENSFTELAQKIADTVEMVLGVALEIGNALFDARKQRLQEELEYLNEWEAERTALAGDNEEAREAIEREAERRRRQIAREQAIAEKRQAMFTIALQTAIGVARALASSAPPKNFVEAALVAGLGAVQLAIAASKRIPAFAKGTKSSPEGVAVVGEKGSEIIVDRQGNARLTPDRPTLTDLKAGSRVFTANETDDILRSLRNGDINNTITQEFLSKMHSQKLDVENILKGFQKELRNMPKDEFYIDENGFNKFQQKGLRRTQILNKRYGFKR